MGKVNREEGEWRRGLNFFFRNTEIALCKLEWTPRAIKKLAQVLISEPNFKVCNFFANAFPLLPVEKNPEKKIISIRCG
jgi:hypothetical protein